MKIIRESIWKEGVDYSLHFEYRDCPGAGFCFECDEHGAVDESTLKPAALENYRKCLSGEHDVVSQGVGAREWCYQEPRVGKCPCGCRVELPRFTNECGKCGNLYNSTGQLLSNPAHWGEETGERPSECW